MNSDEDAKGNQSGGMSYFPEVFVGIVFTIIVTLLIGTVLEPQLLGLPVFASLAFLILGSIFFFLGTVIGFGGVFYLARTVGPRFGTSPSILCQNGPYAYVRNPGYLWGIIVTLGLALLFFSPILPLYAILTWSRLHLIVVRHEEPILTGIFGDEYETYKKQAGRWLPKLKRQ